MIGGSKIFVTGAGIVSSIGTGKEKTLEALMSGCTGIDKMKYLLSCHNELPVGEVKMSNKEMIRDLGVKNPLFIPRTSLLGIIALKEALNEACINKDDLSKIPFVSSTTVGGIDLRELYYAEENECGKDGAIIATENCASCTEMIADYFGDFASLTTISTACSSAMNSIILGMNLINSGIAEIVVVGGCEALSMYHLNGFNSLMILDHQQCKPFDNDRNGLNLGEGAAYLVIESENSALSRKQAPLCVLKGYGNACDAFHQTAVSEEGTGPFLAMSKALHMANLCSDEIQYINAHGTGTRNNDISEWNAIRRVFGVKTPPISSTKSYTGHTTSASGSIETVISILSIKHNFLPLNLNWKNKMENGFTPVTDMRPSKRICNIMVNSFGFGGNDSSLIISSPYQP